MAFEAESVVGLGAAALVGGLEVLIRRPFLDCAGHRATCSRQCQPRPIRFGAVAITIALLLTILATGCGGTAHRGVVVTVDLRHPGPALPSDFLGLSYEASVLSSNLFDPRRSNLAPLMRDLGPGRLRFGGNSVDRVAAWSGDGTAPLPPWAHAAVSPDDLARLGALSTATGWKIDLGLTLGHPDPVTAAAEVVAARRLIGNGLGTVQVGNEPDLLGDVRPGYGEAGYRSDVIAYRAAIAAAAPGAAISGPDTANPTALSSYAAGWGAGLALLTQHFYPLTRCQGSKPTIDQLLSPSALATEARVAGTAAAAAHAIARPVRLDETNSASCGGQDGVSNTLASALWMVEYLATVAQHGVSGVGIQGGLAACRGYTPLCVPGAQGAAAGTGPGIDATADASLGAAPAPGGRLATQPEFYGLLLVHELESGRWLPLAANQHGPEWEAAVEMPDGAVKVVVVNPSPGDAADITVRGLGSIDRAGVQWLTGPSLTATSGVTLGGAAVGADGGWQPHPDTALSIDANSVAVQIPAASAALVTLSTGSS